MKKILTYLWLVLCTVMASSAYANTCDVDPNECTPKNLCAAATSQKNGNTIWSDAANASKHVSFAKELGINCGVVEIVDPCDADANECKISQLCEKAIVESNNRISWSIDAEPYVKLAKAYGLTCGVQDTKKATCKDDPKICNNGVVCNWATKKEGLKWIWHNSSKSKVYVQEAKRRGLTCGVQDTKKAACKDEAKNCKSSAMCYFATKVKNGQTVWETKPKFQQHVLEAKKRNLICGVNNTAKTTNNNPKPQLLGSWTGSINCKGTIYPFNAKLSKSNGSNVLYMNTANFVYKGSYLANLDQKTIRLKGKRSDGDIFNEVFKIDSNILGFQEQRPESVF